MRKSLLLYLLVFAVLIAVFQYVSSRKMLESKDEEISAIEDEIEEMSRRCDSITAEFNSRDEFSFTGNDAALSYFENRGYNPSEIAERVRDQIIGRNKASEDNNLVPFEGMEGFMRINNIKILNHKWIIASFTDGSYWGEVFIEYSIDDDNNLDLKTQESLLYPLQ
ncbi:hypothetical protein [Salinimicrobium sp. GXAS 041]|uniref:hypothetical protein n=1 Tax=Salinimicrobium sp. GXAS 041 TaxID=3400806 RepID=UPI003C753FF0